MNIFLVAAADACGGLRPIVSVIKGLFDILRILVPIALLIFGALDLAKAVIASDEKEIKGAKRDYPLPTPKKPTPKKPQPKPVQPKGVQTATPMSVMASVMMMVVSGVGMGMVKGKSE